MNLSIGLKPETGLDLYALPDRVSETDLPEYHQILFRLQQAANKTGQPVNLYAFDPVFIGKSIVHRMEDVRISNIPDYVVYYENEPSELLRLHDLLFNGYSEFFRNPLTFAVLEKVILPNLLSGKRRQKRKEIRIWSAACSSGQEVYSLAILLEELAGNSSDTVDYRIFASDSSEIHIQEARAGVYPAASLGSVTLRRKAAWFSPAGDKYVVKPILKEKIDFSTFDLLGDPLSSPASSIFGDFDLIFCANLLFYYKPEFQRTMLEKAQKSLSNIGYLVVGETERDILMNAGFFESFPQSSIFSKLKFKRL